MKKIKKVKLSLQRNKTAAIILSTLFLILTVVISLTLNIALNARQLARSTNQLITSVQQQDLQQINKNIQVSKADANNLKKAYSKIYWLSFTPFMGSYISDGKHLINSGIYTLEATEILAKSLEPYADIIGFSHATASSPDQTADNRLQFFIEALPQLTPSLQQVAIKADLVKTELSNINPNKYPKSIKGYPLRQTMQEYISFSAQATEFITKGQPLLEQAPYLLGVENTRKYLVIFQNDKELRPTGGFMTGYTIMEVKDGQFSQTSSTDIYELDAQYTPVVPAPEPLVKYLKGEYEASPNYRLRDMNFSPDFKTSMDLFTQEVGKTGLEEVDGVIAVDTQTVVSILDVIGPIGVPGFGNFSTEPEPECNCPQVIYELESFADVEGPIVWDPNSGEVVYRPPNSENRKGILGPLMNSMIANMMGQPAQKLPALFNALYDSLTQKHVLFYLNDPNAQKAADSFEITGKIASSNQDYLHINDANLGGRKSNLYVTQEVEQEIEIDPESRVTKTLSITYKNPQKFDGWLNSVLPNYTRIYVPKGSRLVSSHGFEEEYEPYEELDKTVFAGFFQLRPEGIVKLSLTYELPLPVNEDSYELLIQKQPGKTSTLHTILFNSQITEKEIKKDELFILQL